MADQIDVLKIIEEKMKIKYILLGLVIIMTLCSCQYIEQLLNNPAIETQWEITYTEEVGTPDIITAKLPIEISKTGLPVIDSGLEINLMIPGLYLATLSIQADKILIRDLDGKYVGTYLDYAINGIADSSYTRIIYPSNAITSEGMHFFGSEFAVYDLTQNKVSPILTPNDETGYGSVGDWSPQDDMVIVNYTFGSGTIQKLGLISIAESNIEEIKLWDSEVSDPEWSNDGAWIAFSSKSHSENSLQSSIYTIDADCLIQPDNCLYTIKKIFSNIDESYFAPSWAPDNTRMVFGCTNMVTNITSLCLGNFQTGEILRIENTTGIFGSPNWSPNGEWICDALDGKVVILRPDGSEMKIISNDETFLFWIYIPDA